MVDNPKTAFGNAKPCLHYVPMKAMLEVAEVMRTGAIKYGTKNWRQQPVAASIYYDACHRHLIDWFEGREDLDKESQKSHLAHAICCLLILMDGLTIEGFVDDRKFTEVLTNQPVAQTGPIEAFVSVGLRDTIWDRLLMHGHLSLEHLARDIGRPDALVLTALELMKREGRARFNKQTGHWYLPEQIK